jgi:hypothetical protein
MVIASPAPGRRSKLVEPSGLVVLLLALDAYLAFGLLFLAGAIGWAAAWHLRAVARRRRSAGGGTAADAGRGEAHAPCTGARPGPGVRALTRAREGGGALSGTRCGARPASAPVAPDRSGGRRLPAFRLHAFERNAATGRPVIRMNVIVGRAEGRHATPLFSVIMREAVVQPYCDIPPGIARAELLPAIRRDPGYPAREHLGIVRGGDREAAIYHGHDGAERGQ